MPALAQDVRDALPGPGVSPAVCARLPWDALCALGRLRQRRCPRRILLLTVVSALVLAARVVLGLVFAIALVSKARGRDTYRGFVNSLDGLPWLPVRLTGVVGGAVMLAEAGTVGLLAIPATVPIGLGLAAATLAAFLAGVAASMRRGARLRCRCFGSEGDVMGIRHVVRNALLLALALAGLAATAATAGGVSAPVSVLVGGLALIAAVLVIRLDDLAYVITGRAGNGG